MAKLESVAEDSQSVKMSTEVSTLTVEQSCAGAGEKGAVPCLIPAFADACRLVDTPYSCLVVETHRRHIALSPMYLRKKKTGIQEQLNAELLKYSESLNGVPLAYDDIKVVGQHGDIHDDSGLIHMNIEAMFVIFQPRRGQKLSGVINKVGVSHVGCLVHGCFNAAVPRPAQVTQEAWLQAGLGVGHALEFQVSQLDADTAGVLLIRGRLDKHRTRNLAEVGGAGGVELTEVPTTRKKKKDKNPECDWPGVSLETGESPIGEFVAVDTDADVNMNLNGLDNGKKRKRKREEEEDRDSCGYHSDKNHRKDGAELTHSPVEPGPKKKKKKKKDKRSSQ